MKKLQVVQDKEGHWHITGFTGGKKVRLLFHIPYPRSEWPEVTDPETHEEMLGALYDEWQGSEELAAEAKKHGTLVFETPWGNFATYSFHVAPVEAVAAAAGKLLKDYNAARDNVRTLLEAQVGELTGWTKKKNEAIQAKYGNKFTDWPKEEVKAYWDAYTKVDEMLRTLFPQD